MKTLSPEQLIEQVAKSARKKLLPEEKKALAQEFMAAGTKAVQARIGSTREAAQALNFARDLSQIARMQLARKTTSHLKTPLQSPDWARLARIILEHKVELTRLPGVLGIGLGYRRKAGIREQEKAVIISVERKLTGEELGMQSPLPTTLTAANGETVNVDVVALGKFRRSTSAGSSLGQGDDSGTLGVFAQDIETRQLVALTAQHVIGSRVARDLQLFAPWPQTQASVLIGSFLNGTMHETDAASIVVADPDTMVNIIPEIGRVNGWRPVVSSDFGMPVWMYGAVSGYQLGEIEILHHDMPQQDLIDTLVVRIRAQPGDSGAVILDRQNLVLGLLVGGDAGSPFNIFTPISLVLDRLGCRIATN